MDALPGSCRRTPLYNPISRDVATVIPFEAIYADLPSIRPSYSRRQRGLNRWGVTLIARAQRRPI
ncbi:hypothetical protein [Nocardia sp. AB354]|uniref:hypothetical protein n=1 Tax=Nocardia sp. AB354 TaxID=3413283 RepID=UPI003C1F2C1F